MAENTAGSASLIADELMRRDELISDLTASLRSVIATGLNGGNNVRLALIAAGQKELSDADLELADASEHAVAVARDLIAKVEASR